MRKGLKCRFCGKHGCCVSQWGCCVVTTLNILNDWSFGRRYAVLVARLLFILPVSIDHASMWSPDEWLMLEKRGLIFRVPNCMVNEIIEGFLRERIRRLTRRIPMREKTVYHIIDGCCG